jgi:hypothetical protein
VGDITGPRTVFGRVCLLGDAAFVVRHHTAGTAAKAARRDGAGDRAQARRQNVDAGLACFEEIHLECVRISSAMV